MVAANTVYVMIIGIYAAGLAFALGRPRLVVTVIPAAMLRMLMGVLTRMPMPRGTGPASKVAAAVPPAAAMLTD